ncbi:MAG: hypothetical protein ACPGVU_24785, partial [Limisphaerales bacterium]
RNVMPILLGVLLLGCGLQTDPKPVSSNPETRNPRPRDYVETIPAPDRSDLAVIKCQYLGKEPEKPIETEISRDWKTADTDFYHFAITNVSEHPITLSKVKYRLAEVRHGAVHRTATKADIEKEFGTAVIEPGKSVVRRNSWVWGMNEQSRTMHKTYLGQSNNQDVKLDVVLVYRLGK